MITNDGTPSFHAEEWLVGHSVAVVKCDQVRDRDNPGLVGNFVFVDGELFKCIGVERTLPFRPIQIGELIGLKVVTEKRAPHEISNRCVG